MNDILFGNNNKAVIKKLANRNFRSNKMRNVIAVIAIALTTFLFTAVLTIGMGAKGTLEYNMAKMIGTGADALVQGLSEEQFQQLKENSMFEKVGCWVPIEIMTNTNRIFAEIDYADQPQLELRMQTPRTGSAPQKANEVLVSANILNDLNIEEKIGAEIPIEFKNRQSGQMYHFDNPASPLLKDLPFLPAPAVHAAFVQHYCCQTYQIPLRDLRGKITALAIGATFLGRSEDTACLFIFQSVECAGLTRRPFCFLFCFTFMYMTCLSQF